MYIPTLHAYIHTLVKHFYYYCFRIFFSCNNYYERGFFNQGKNRIFVCFYDIRIIFEFFLDFLILINVRFIDNERTIQHSLNINIPLCAFFSINHFSLSLQRQTKNYSNKNKKKQNFKLYVLRTFSIPTIAQNIFILLISARDNPQRFPYIHTGPTEN